MAAAAVETFTMPLELHHVREESLMDAVFGPGSPLTRPASDKVDLPRAASYHDFSSLHDNQSDSTSTDGTRDSSSIDEKEAARQTQYTSPVEVDKVTPATSGATTPESEVAPSTSHTSEQSSVEDLRKGLPELSTSDNDVPRDIVLTDDALTTPAVGARGSASSDDLPGFSPSTSANHLSARFRRRSWMPSSRSPSPTKTRKTADNFADAFGSVVRRSSPFGKSVDSEGKDGSRSRSSSLSRSISNRLTKRPQAPVSEDGPKTSSPQVNKPSQLSKSFSTDRLSLSALTKSRTSSTAPPLPSIPAKDKQRMTMIELSKKRDELWTVFRNLDGEYQKFQGKPTALKANVIRASLLPFLRDYQSHSSTFDLRLEDLERRANILNKWWSSLLELINNKNQQSISGTDRPVIFDAIIGIMERPEWRLPPSPLAPLRSSMSRVGHKATTSIGSVASASSGTLLADSVVHNVRNLFSNNLADQMCFVVEKMSMRNTPASSVSFCGRTCAYAFFFCPGIADVLVRLWNPTMDLLTRVLQECGHKRSTNLEATAQQICMGFPSHLLSVKFNNISATYRSLRKSAPLPLRTHDVPWSCHSWVGRWCGKDSDLFYVFVKHFHLLVTDFLPSETTRTERLCAPGVIFVHAQILSNMDGTINRNITPSPMDPGQSTGGNTFEDILADPDSSAPAFPLPPATNASRMMAENRMIMLVRDLLAERNANAKSVRHMFAIAFSDLLRAAARRTSVYSPNACYVLCDLLEEAFLILVRYEQSIPSREPILDWTFWMDVWKGIVQSHNTTTEIRLYALLYSVWPALAIEPDRKMELCTSFLLEPVFFQSRFNHWCPMVRAYFMRLLCWRVARCDGSENSGDLEILEQLSDGLQTQYSHYLYQRETAQRSSMALPSTAPCNPAPGRRLLIVRTDHGQNQPRNGFMSFDGVLTPHPGQKRLSGLSEIVRDEARPVSNSSDDSEPDAEDKGSKKWGLLRTIIGTSKQETVTRTSNPVQVRGERRESFPSQPRTILRDSVMPFPERERPYSRPFTFKFSLEWADRLDRRLQTPGPMRIAPPRLPMAAQTLLNNSRTNTRSSRSPSSSIRTSSTDAKSMNSDSSKSIEIGPIEPKGDAKVTSQYTGRALAEWMLVVMECGSFFDRRKAEGVPANRFVETPNLGIESFKRPG